MAITLWLSLIECRELNLIDEMILTLGDNTCAISLIFKSGLRTKSIYRNMVLFIAKKSQTSSLIPIVLSTPKTYQESFPQLVPANFRVSPLPTKILSFARQAIQTFESSLTQRQRLDLKA